MIREETLRQATILIVDDEPANVRLLEQILEAAGYAKPLTTTDPREAIELYSDARPDLVLLDLRMPQMDGFQVMERLSELDAGGHYVPILVLTADPTREVKKRALLNGAKDLLTKPFDYSEVLLRIRNLLTTRFLQLDLQKQNELLDQRVRERTAELEEARLEVLERLGRAAEFRDDDTGQHTRRVGEFSARVASRLDLPEERVELVRLAAPLHDIGKIAIPDSILLKPGKLTPEEWEVMKTHTTAGARLLAGSSSELLQVAERIALSHHERWDGGGYPHGLAGEAIPLVARIVAVVDVFDALRSDRPYRSAWPLERVVAHIRQESGSHFDPRVAGAFLDWVEAEGIVEEVLASA